MHTELGLVETSPAHSTSAEEDTVYPDEQTRIEGIILMGHQDYLSPCITCMLQGWQGEEELADLTIQAKAAVLLSRKR